MKIKSPHETAGIGKLHGYLGHFAQARHINRGHNDTPMRGKVYSDTKPKYDEGFGLPTAQHNADSEMAKQPRLPRDENSYDPLPDKPRVKKVTT